MWKVEICFQAKVDVIVCDGFVGNIALKICEGLAVQIFGLAAKIAGGVR